MRSSFRIAVVLGTLALLFTVGSHGVATGSERHSLGDGGHHARGGAIIPAGRLLGGYLLREWWEPALSVPADDPSHPFNADGCILRGPIAFHYGGSCTVPEGTVVFIVAASTECSDVEDPPFHAETPRQARQCGLLGDRPYTTITETLDGGTSVDLLDGRFDAFIPWSRVVIPESPIFGGTPGETMRYGGHGFVALVWSLPPGEHTVARHLDGVEEPGLEFPIDDAITITVTPRPR
jgi:hypothetical protein